MPTNTPPRPAHSAGFTLIELLVVIAIIAVLMGLLFPTVGAVKETARKAQAKNDCVQIVTATKAYYAEYGKYPVTEGSSSDDTYSDNNDRLMNVLRATGGNGYDLEMNPRKIAFLEPPIAKDPSNPKSGIGGSGDYYDPWGERYWIRMDSDYNNEISNPYSGNAGFGILNTGVIAWSLGKDKSGGSGDKKSGQAADDVISWQ
jgi:prepilin-type N-terminal cleavage/methylation domain-containing protein